jgi:hypothetical protein
MQYLTDLMFYGLSDYDTNMKAKQPACLTVVISNNIKPKILRKIKILKYKKRVSYVAGL